MERSSFKHGCCICKQRAPKQNAFSSTVATAAKSALRNGARFSSMVATPPPPSPSPPPSPPPPPPREGVLKSSVIVHRCPSSVRRPSVIVRRRIWHSYMAFHAWAPWDTWEQSCYWGLCIWHLYIGASASGILTWHSLVWRLPRVGYFGILGDPVSPLGNICCLFCLFPSACSPEPC
jgi:hypothetical protein